jgi:hypothetical protein
MTAKSARAEILRLRKALAAANRTIASLRLAMTAKP